MAYDQGLAERIYTILSPQPGFSERKMFGGIAFMINQHMCCGVIKTDLMLRMSPEAVAAGLGKPHTRPMDFTHKPMKGMLMVEAEGCCDDESLHAWVHEALSFVRSLPAKSDCKKPLKRGAR